MTVYTKTYWSKKKLLTFCGLYVAAMSIGLMQTSYGLIPFGIAGAFLVLISAVVVGVVVDLFYAKKKTFEGWWFYFVSLLTFLSITCFFVFSNIQSHVTDNRAEEIIKELEEFKAAKGHYPPNLEALTNHNLYKVPPTAYGVLRQDFQYNSQEPTAYQIYYHAYFGVEHSYNSETGEWSVND